MKDVNVFLSFEVRCENQLQLRLFDFYSVQVDLEQVGFLPYLAIPIKGAKLNFHRFSFPDFAVRPSQMHPGRIRTVPLMDVASDARGTPSK
jgi:hypothetical protein